MKKLLGALLAMTALVPAAASAQEARGNAEVGTDGDGRGGGRERWRERRGEAGADARAERRAARLWSNDGVGDGRADRGSRRDLNPDRRFATPIQGRDDAGARLRTVDDDLAVGDYERAQDRRTNSRDRRYDADRARRQDRRNDRSRWAAQPDWARSRLADRRDDAWAYSQFEERRAWNHGWRDDDRYDWNDYRSAYRNAYRLPRYYAPYGWGGGYRRFGVGVSLQSSLWGRNYWIDDPWAYRLPDAYGSYRWVRYYDDALLVDLRSGRVVDAVYGIFW